ncbi:cation-translocating P-type ATPase [Brachymonas denitrificans]|uniref:heavy metal translocating P-type ATPase n=1 Tax=Brachymonas denitrificans TaxID=28220 RepID=UPI002AFE5EA5|nr:cation-translocating P-type ATPase [Brachymonas denitrificans]
MSTVALPANATQIELLDDPDEWGAFSRRCANQADTWESSVAIEGMHCAACALTVEDALKAVPGVKEVQVSPGSHRARVTWLPEQVKPSQWMQALQGTGYRAVPANDAFASQRRRQEARQTVWQWGVAGVVMMQVMMYAWPEYVSDNIAPEARHLLRWGSWILSVLVVLFSCRPFFRNALNDIRHRRISMDLPVALGMLITFIVSTLGTFEPDGMFGREVYFDSLTMFVFFLLTGRWLEWRVRDRTAGALEALMNRLPESVERRNKKGIFERVTLRRLKVGDLVRVLPGESFPGDGTVVDGRTMVDEALLTGESRPLARETGAQVIAGSHNIQSPIEMRIDKLGANTRYAQIVEMMENASVDKPRLAQFADRFAKPFLIVVLLAAGLSAAWWWQEDPAHAVMIAVAVLIVTCPCALSLATPAAMLAAAGGLARRGVLVRRLQALEMLSQIDTVVFDKTGTLTADTIALERVLVRAGADTQQVLLQAAALARHSLHPVSRALVEAAGLEGEALLQQQWIATHVTEHPGKGMEGQVASCGAEAPSGQTMRLGSDLFCGVSPQTIAELPPDTLHANLSDEQGWLATFVLREDLRADAQAAVDTLRDAGLRLQVLSGDRPHAVQRIADQLGLEQAQGGCTASDKLSFLRAEQQRGHHVAMVGDGINDGPVLAGAHVSFALGKAVPLAQAQSDFVILGSSLQAVADSFRLARSTMRVVRENLLWAALYNLIGIPLAVMGLVPAWLAGLGMAASSLLVVLNALRLVRKLD